MKIIADTHCHTVASTHAYSSVQEMVAAAKEKNLVAVAITDHSQYMPGSPGPWYFRNLVILPNIVDGIYLLKGIEVNVCDPGGYLDMDNFTINRLNWVVASMHDETFHHFQYNMEAVTSAWLSVAKNPLVNVIGHSGMEEFQYDYEKVIPEFGRNGKLVEINNNSFRVRRGAKKNCKQIALVCKKYGVPVILNSDAHSSFQVGNVEQAQRLLEEIDFPEELIVNSNKEKFDNYLKKYTNFFD
ncbi:MAG: phosphatase [Oscillospiraceae bacterium]|jgi:putative hydrolase|nr:phosphatase [Oscillospiraceae bacterium]